MHKFWLTKQCTVNAYNVESLQLSPEKALQPFFCTLRHPGVKTFSCCLCLFTLPEALCLLKTCLFTSGAQQVFEESAMWNCASHCCCKTHLLKCSPFLNKIHYAFRLVCTASSSRICKSCQWWKGTS